jgi:DNA-directed RNA polymerase specialized sigma24 family protein
MSPIHDLYQHYSLHKRRGNTAATAHWEEKLFREARERMVRFARRVCSVSDAEDVASQALVQFINAARQGRYRTICDGLLGRMVLARQFDLARIRRRRPLLAFDASCEEDPVGQLIHLAHARNFQTRALSNPMADNLHRLPDACPHLSPREFAALVHLTEQENPWAAQMILNNDRARARVLSDRDFQRRLQDLREGRVPPNTAKQWVFSMRRRMESLGLKGA